MKLFSLIAYFAFPAAAAAHLNAREDHRCGLEFRNATCESIWGRCCSKYGFCGKTDSHCLLENGCQSGCTLIITNATELIPWSWTVKPSPKEASHHPCPGVASILITFAVINLISGSLSTIFGHRLVIKKLSFGLFGKRGGNSWMYMWIVPLAMQLGANAIVAAIIQRTPGYGSDFTIAQLMFFFAARPRISWILVMLLSGVKKTKPTKRQDDRQPLLDGSPDIPVEIELTDKKNSSIVHTTKQPLVSTPPITESFEDDYYWRNAALSQYWAEIFLQVFTLYYMGKTVVFAQKHGYYSPGTLPGAIGHNARIMYSGALFWLCAQSFVYLTAPTFIFVLLKEGGGVNMVAKLMQMLGSLLVVTSWMASWLFWAGFVRLAGDLYCPPKLVQQGAIWTAFSSVGMMAGVGI